MRATIAWSHDLLTEDEQRLFARLAVFVGGCTYGAAEEVAGADPDTLQLLLDKSLLRKRDAADEPRYWMLETIREYAVERLEESGDEDELRRRHAEWFVALAEEAGPNLTGSPKAWLDRLEDENANVRTAVDLPGGKRQRPTHAAAVWRDLALLDDARPHHGRSAPVGDRARGRFPCHDRTRKDAERRRETFMALETGDHGAARRHAEEAIDLHRVIDDPWGEGISLGMLGGVRVAERDFEAAQRFFEAALEKHRDFGDDHRVLQAMDNIAWVREELGDVSGARALTEEVLRRARAAGNLRMQILSLSSLGVYALREDRVCGGASAAGGELRDQPRSRRQRLVLRSRPLRVGSRDRRERRRRRTGLCGRGDVSAGDRPFRDGAVSRARKRVDACEDPDAQLDEGAFARAWDEGTRMTRDQAVALALAARQPDS